MGRLAVAQCRALLACLAASAIGARAVATECVESPGRVLRACVSVDGSIAHEWFAGQYMVRYHQKVVEAAWPNMISREGARGQEYNAWARPTSSPDHLTILPFTRMLSGPMDFTPGIFDVTFGHAQINERVQSTIATQLAEYVVLYSPIQMAADLPENYRPRPDAFRFIEDVPTDWETSRTLDAVIGEYVVVARLERGGHDWYLGAITNGTARSLDVALAFLQQGARYEAQIYRDGPGADYRTNPESLAIERRIVGRGDRLKLAHAPGGGQAVRFRRLAG
jgi:alpha-glucosidase